MLRDEDCARNVTPKNLITRRVSTRVGPKTRCEGEAFDQKQKLQMRDLWRIFVRLADVTKDRGLFP